MSEEGFINSRIMKEISNQRHVYSDLDVYLEESRINNLRTRAKKVIHDAANEGKQKATLGTEFAILTDELQKAGYIVGEVYMEVKWE